MLREAQWAVPAISRATEWPYCPNTADPRKKSSQDLYVLLSHTYTLWHQYRTSLGALQCAAAAYWCRRAGQHLVRNKPHLGSVLTFEKARCSLHGWRMHRRCTTLHVP